MGGYSGCYVSVLCGGCFGGGCYGGGCRLLCGGYGAAIMAAGSWPGSSAAARAGTVPTRTMDLAGAMDMTEWLRPAGVRLCLAVQLRRTGGRRAVAKLGTFRGGSSGPAQSGSFRAGRDSARSNAGDPHTRHVHTVRRSDSTGSRRNQGPHSAQAQCVSAVD